MTNSTLAEGINETDHVKYRKISDQGSFFEEDASFKHKAALNFFHNFASETEDGHHLLSGKGVEKFLGSLGFTSSDPRVEPFLTSLLSDENSRKDGFGFKMLNFEEFLISVKSSGCSFLLERIFRGDLAIPQFEDFKNKISEIYDSVKADIPTTAAKLASYIPQLAEVDPNLFGVTVCTVDGQTLEFGDSRLDFCIQSCCKPITYCLALEENGDILTHKHVGKEPSGVAFNNVSLNADGLPHNPMINSGAIMTCSLIKRNEPLFARFDYMIKQYTLLSGGGKWGFNNSVYLSEKQTADNNVCLAYLMRGRKRFPEGTNIEETLDFYFQNCSIETNCYLLASVGATIAAGGNSPFTGKSVLRPQTCTNCLSLMLSSGMYDYSGQWAFSVGIPAKSGVSGVIFGVIPNCCSICVYSPPLDSIGNSVRGVEFFKRLVKLFSFHNFDSLILGKEKIDPRKNIHKVDNFNRIHALYAAADGDSAELRKLISAGVSPNTSDYDHRSLLHLACSEGHLSVLQILLRRGAFVNPLDRWNSTPLDDAIKYQHEEETRLLRSAGGKTSKELQDSFEKN